MRASALKLILVVVAALVALWLLGALVQGLLISLSLTTGRFFLFYWWFQKFGLGVVVGFVLGVLAGWFLFSQGAGGREEARAHGPVSDHLEEARRQLAALEKELAAESEER
jgi:hypothetical protein